MSREIRKAAVLGSGVMGSAIAAHLAGNGIPVVMLDIVPFPDMLSEGEKAKVETDKKIRNKLAAQSLKAALKVKPPAFYSKKDAALIEIGNFDDDFEKIADCDWIIEVVVERMDIKKMIMGKIDQYRKKGSIVSSNTSGLSVDTMVSDCSEEMQQHFLGTHFFNPVRFMKLLEIIPHPKTNEEVLAFMEAFCKERLGKGVIWAKDTPNFVANRIGVHGMMATMKAMADMDYRIDEVDAIVGPPLGRPKTAAFKTADLVGLDTLHHVAMTVVNNCPDDESLEAFRPPGFLDQMVEKKMLGNKTRGGFYKRVGKQRLVLDWKTMEYVDAERPTFDSIKAAKGKGGLEARVKHIVYSDDRAGQFAWRVAVEGLLYTARRVPEIADAILEIDRGMKWGFNWRLGPFETWDAIGVRESVERMQAEGHEIPENILAMLENGNETFYKTEDGKKFQYDLVNHTYVEIPKDPQIIILPEDSAGEVWKNDGATLWDMGDGVICCEFHTKMNAIDQEIIDGLHKMVDLLEEGQFEAGVVGNHADNFSVGANVFMILMAMNQGQSEMVEKLAYELQRANMRMKYCKRPVVTAPAGMALGGGCEVTLHGQRVVAAAETYIGLVEVGVGVIPAGGGTKEMVLRTVEGRRAAGTAILPFAQKAFENIAMAKVAVGMKDAVDNMILRPTDVMVPNRDLLLHRAKEVALGLAEAGFDPGLPRTDIPVGGESTRAAFTVAAKSMRDSGWISDYDVFIATKIAYIIGGGDRWEGQKISEWELLDMEREAFMSLLGEDKTKERIAYMLQNNKPLRN
ncbi:MAG: 3-hydroxyacyl-CoA dehydrogenase/enoyl-CoA hydratase family protein [Candidatus Lernaella stagnicola]|nr:3-hydroxyacyl-CoA dehydrogenase/enoyl-CoA hydratase family protein [Candidatus Lernaella stagnicola]